MRDGRPSPEVSGDFAEFRHGLPRFGRIAFNSMRQTVIDVVVDEGLLGRRDRLLDSLELLGEVEASSTVLHHLDDGAQMALGALEALDDGGMRGMGDVRHVFDLSPW